MIGVRVIEADNVLAALAAFALEADELARVDVVAVLGRILVGVCAAHDLAHTAGAAFETTEQDTAALMRIGLLSVAADFCNPSLVDLQHKSIRLATHARNADSSSH
jgi:hypothetical protein